MNTLTISSNISVAEAIQLELQTNYSREIDSFDAESDRQYALNHQIDRWFSADHRHKIIADTIINTAISD